MRVHVEGGGTVALLPEAFVAAGGEAAVYAVGDTAYKVMTGPVDAARLRALGALAVAGAALPTALLRDDDGAVVGHTMRFLGRATPLARALARGWRERAGMGPSEAMAVVRRLRDRVAAVHRAGALVVDLHEGNVLLDDAWSPWLVDTSSWQLPGFPATAVQDGVRDPFAAGFDAGTDWFAFAVTTLHLLLGLHPYRGTHPTVTGLDARRRARISVLDPAVKRPASSWPPSVLPPRWRDWYQAVLGGDHRGPPPPGDADAIGALPAPGAPGGALRRTLLLRAPGPIRGVVAGDGAVSALLDDGAWVDERLTPLRADALAAGPDGRLLAARADGGALRVREVATGRDLPVTLACDAVTAWGAGFLVRSGPRLLEVQVRAGVLVPRLLAAVAPHAIQLFDGLAVEDLLGAAHLRLLSPGRCETRRVPELDGWAVLDAHHAGGVAALVARRAGRTDRLVLRFGPRGHELRRDEDVDGADLSLAALPGGLAALRADGALELFRARPGDAEIRRIEDPALVGARLFPLDGGLGAVIGPSVYRLSLAP
jgi:hypothetical protein